MVQDRLSPGGPASDRDAMSPTIPEIHDPGRLLGHAEGQGRFRPTVEAQESLDCSRFYRDSTQQQFIQRQVGGSVAKLLRHQRAEWISLVGDWTDAVFGCVGWRHGRGAGVWVGGLPSACRGASDDTYLVEMTVNGRSRRMTMRVPAGISISLPPRLKTSTSPMSPPAPAPMAAPFRPPAMAPIPAPIAAPAPISAALLLRLDSPRMVPSRRSISSF